jgi:anti-sigma factor RsiW
MSCDRALPLLYHVIDGEIEREDAQWLALHLATCRTCAQQLLQIQKANTFYAERMAVAPPPDLARRIMESAEAERVTRRRDAFWVGLAALVAAACLVVALVGGRGESGTLAGALWERGDIMAQVLASLSSGSPRALLERAAGLPEDLAHVWPYPAMRRGTPTILAVMIAIQLLGSFWLLAFRKAGRREERAP